MHFKRLEIQGFKTFAQRTVFEFRPGLTAIVGPNGSGKSNVSDAVRWVLGEQSFTTLRCKRTEELLFSGGHRRAPAGLAEVSLTLDNSDRLLPLAFDEVTFTRRATRAGDNEYFINRAKVRLRDVLEATEPLGGSYTIINQGLVDTALTLRPEERRRLFEDAAEIGGFEARKSETERRLRETDGNMQRIDDLLSELEPRLRSLKRQATQARQARELSASLHELLLAHYATAWREAQAAQAAAQAEAVRSEEALAHARAAQTQSSATLGSVRTTLRELRARLGQLQQQSGELHQQAEAAQRELAVGNERQAALVRRIEELERSQGELQVRQEEALHEHNAAQAALAAAEAARLEQRVRVNERETTLAHGEAERRALAQEVARAQDAALKAATALAEQRSRAEQLATQAMRLREEQAGQEAAARTAEERLIQARTLATEAQAVLDSERLAHETAQAAEEAARTVLETLRRERTTADEALASARRVAADVEARRESLERLARSYAGVFAGVKAAMQWAERSGRSGFVLVATIVRTPPQLETAIEVALGSRLQNIVVEAWQDAEDAIAELKRSGAGRATFMPLDSMRTENREPRTENHQIGSQFSVLDSVLGSAAELVDFDQHYRAVVWQLLGRTLVVRDMATARQELRRLGGGWGIVTLGGEQVSGGGAITGGAQTRESGALRRERELRELPGQVAAAREAVAAAETRRNALAERVAFAERALREAETTRRECSRSVDARRAALDAAQRGVARAEQENGWQRSRRDVATRDLAALAEQDTAVGAAIAAAEAQVAVAQEQLAVLRARQEAQTSSDSAAQAELAELRATLAQAEGQVSAGRTLAMGRQQTLDRLARERSDATRRSEELARERDTITAQRSSVAQRHDALLAQIDALRELIGPAENALVEHEARQAVLEGEESASTSALLEREAAHNRATLDRQRAVDRIETVQERAAVDGVTLADDMLGNISSPVEPSEVDLQSQIQQLKSKIERLGTINPLALEEYEESAERHSFLSSQIADLRHAHESLRTLIAELDGAMEARFVSTFKAVAAEFEHSFTQLFGGGAAQLRLVGSPEAGAETHDGSDTEHLNGNGTEPRTARGVVGVEIVARPPGKRQQNMSLLSGGERTLTAAALLFAILKVNPSPFCILDEMDAALDESNVGRFRDALVGIGQQTQFIVITHNRGTIEAATTLYGISMGEDSASRVLSLKLEELIAEA